MNNENKKQEFSSFKKMMVLVFIIFGIIMIIGITKNLYDNFLFFKEKEDTFKMVLEIGKGVGLILVFLTIGVAGFKKEFRGDGWRKEWGKENEKK